MRTLVLGALPQDYAPESHVALGPWCFLGREELLDEWTAGTPEGDPFTVAQLADAADATARCARAMIPWATEFLNDVNGTGYSPSFWRIMAMPWLIMAIQTAWERQVRLACLVRRYDEAFRVERADQPREWHVRSTHGFLTHALLDPLYTQWLCGRMLDPERFPRWRFDSVAVSPTEAPGDEDGWGPWRRLRGRLSSRLRCDGVTGIGFLQSVAWSAFLSLKPVHGLGEGEDQARDAADGSEGPRLEWWLDLEGFLRDTVPVSLMGISHLRPVARRPRPGRVRLIGPHLFYDERKKMELALAAEGGERLVVHQHGGNYGTLRAVPMIAELEYRQHAFLTWGWDRHQDYDGRFVPLPSPYLGRFKRSRFTSDQLILVSAFQNVLPYRLDTAPQPLQQVAVRALKDRFLDGLPERVRRHARYRPYGFPRGAISDGPYFAERFPDVTTLLGDLFGHVLRAKLVVLDHPITTLNVCMAANVPTLGLWSDDHWGLSRDAAEVLGRLRALGVIHDDPDDAVAQVERVWDDVDGWWNSREIQEARLAWCQRFAWAARDWRGRWLRALWRL